MPADQVHNQVTTHVRHNRLYLRGPGSPAPARYLPGSPGADRGPLCTARARGLRGQSMPDASPAKWHLAHTTWFFERFVLREAFPELAPCDERYDYIFNSYYDSVGARHSRAERGLLTRPTVDEVLDYRRCVDESMRGLL